MEKLKAVSEHKIPYLDIKQYSGIYCYSVICIYHILATNVYLKTGFLRKNILDIYRSQMDYY
jgi:hypothetical protein